MIELNVTLWFQLANFIITLVVLNYLLISPVREMIRQRREKFGGIAEDIDAFTAKAETELAAYEDTLRQAREEAAALRRVARAEANEAEQNLLTEASREAKEAMRAIQTQLRTEADSAAQKLRGQVQDFAGVTVDKLLR